MKKKKKFLKIAGLACAMLPSMLFMTACGQDKTPRHSHNYSEQWSYNDTNHYHKCDGCDETSGTEPHGYGNWQKDETDTTRHKKSCICGDVEYGIHSGGTATCQDKAICEDCGEEYGDLAGHNHATAWSSDATHHWHACQTEGCTDKSGYAEHSFGNWVANPENPNQHMKTCADCGHIEYENHTFANGIEDCECGAHAPIEEATLTKHAYFDTYDWKSSMKQAETGKLYAFKFQSSAELWYHHVLDVSVRNVGTPISNANIKLYDESGALLSEGKNRIDIQRNTTYYVVVEITSFDEWAASVQNKPVDFALSEKEIVTSFTATTKPNNKTNQYFKLDASGLPTGTKIFMKPTADEQLVDKYGINVVKKNTEDQRFDELLFVPTEYCSYVEHEGIYLTVESGATYYIKLTPLTYHATQFDLENIRIVEDETIATSTHNETKSITMNNNNQGYEAGESFAFKYVVNNIQISDLSINVCDSSGDSFHLAENEDAYQLNVLLDEHGITNTSLYKNITNKFVNDGEVWEYTGTDSLAGKTLIIFITLNEAQDVFYVEMEQKDTIIVSRHIGGGTLEGSETPLELEYKKDYSSTPMNFGVPTNGDLDFYGWCLGSEDGLAIAGVDGQYAGIWQNNPSYQEYDWYGNGEVTVYASYLTARRTVTLNPNGGKWANDSTSNKPSVQITSGQVIADIPTKEGYTFMGYSVTVGGNKIYCAFGDGVAVDISKLIDRTNNAYTLTAEWATTLASCAETVTINSSSLGQFAFTTGNWTLPSEQTTAPTRIELANVSAGSYTVYVSDNQGKSLTNIGNNEYIFDLAPNTQYFIYISGNGTTHTNKKLVITRDLVRNETTTPTSYELKGINIQEDEKVVLRVNPARYGLHWLTINQLSSGISAENVTSVKLLDSNMQEIRTINQSPSTQGQYILDTLNDDTVYYVEIVFSRTLIKMNFCLQ